MAASASGDDFGEGTKRQVAKRAAYICSNPDCRRVTLLPEEGDSTASVFIGVVAHVTAARPGAARYDESLSSEDRRSARNAIYLCANCATMIDKNNGADYPADLLARWTREHEEWLRHYPHLVTSEGVTVVAGEYYARGKGNVTAMDVRDTVIIKGGTRAVAEGEGTVTAVRIGGDTRRRGERQ